MKYLSVCSGIEAATVAWHHIGWKPVGFSEIEKFPSNVLAHHYPDVTNYGDMTKFKEWKLNDTVELLVGGTPCQSFSIAGLRKGLDDPRGNLMLTYLSMADYFKPKWLLWENVPGVLSSNRGHDFANLLQGLAKLGYGFAYRVLDAQYFGVPQRRRRVFVVGCIGDWRSAAKVLFESKSLCRDITPSRKQKQEVTEVVGTLTANGGGLNRPAGNGNELDFCVTTFDRQSSGEYGTSPVASTMSARDYKSASDLIAFKIRGGCEGGGKGYLGNDNTAFTLSTNQDQHIYENMRVRRLTPIECERLQGFPDNYTNIPNAPDTARYKALGNSMAVPVMRWIGERINKID